MKWYILLAAALALAGCATSSGQDGLSLEKGVEISAGAIAGKLPPGTRVAIVGFEAEYENLAASIMDELSGALVNGGLEVADRNNLGFVLKELNFQMSGAVDDESAAGVGKFLGAAYVITGKLVDTGGAYRYRLAVIHVESAKHEVSLRKDRGLFAILQKTPEVSRAASYGGAGSSTPSTAGTFLDRGLMFASREDYDLAMEDFTEAIRLDSGSAIAYVLRGKALMASLSGGEDFYAIAFRGPKKYAQIERIDEAIADYHQGIKLDPQFAMAYLMRGYAYDEKGDRDRAIADYTQAIKLDPQFVMAYLMRGHAYDEKGDRDRAIADYTQAIKLDPNDAKAYFARGRTYWINADYARVHAVFNQTPRGDIYRIKSQYNNAIRDLNKAIRLDPNFACAYAFRGDAYYYKGDYDRALADLEKAISLESYLDTWLDTRVKDLLREIRGN